MKNLNKEGTKTQIFYEDVYMVHQKGGWQAFSSV